MVENQVLGSYFLSLSTYILILTYLYSYLYLLIYLYPYLYLRIGSPILTIIKPTMEFPDHLATWFVDHETGHFGPILDQLATVCLERGATYMGGGGTTLLLVFFGGWLVGWFL